MTYNLTVFQEPRGVMRVIQFIFAICAFATTTSFSGILSVSCDGKTEHHTFSYPFRVVLKLCNINNTEAFVSGDFSSDAQFFVATGVISFLYCIFILILYTRFDELYKTKNQIPLTDFILTVMLAVFWLSGSAAWANGLTGLKSITDAQHIHCPTGCTNIAVSSFSGLNISVILGFLNFFLWASDLWFLYKETPWFQLKQSTSGPITPTI